MQTASPVSESNLYIIAEPFDVPSLRNVPEYWRIVRLKHLTTCPMQYGANEVAESNDPSWPRFVRITDIGSDGMLRPDTFCSLPEEVARPYMLDEGDLLLARSGATVGKSFLYQESWGRCCFAGYLIRVRLNTQKVLPKFVKYYTSSPMYWDWISENTIQATIQNVSAEKYANLLLLLPSIDEQRIIIDYLDRETAHIDSLIAAKELLLDVLAKKKRTIITNFIPFIPNQTDGMISTKWAERKLKYITDVVGGGTPSKENIEYWEGNIPWVSPKDMGTSEILDTEDHVTLQAIEESSTQLVEPGAVLVVCRSGILKHTIPCAINKVAVTLNQDMRALIPHSGVSSRYLQNFIVGHQDTLLALWRKAGATVESLEYEYMMNTKVPLPEYAKQQEISDQLERELGRIENVVDNNQRNNCAFTAETVSADCCRCYRAVRYR